MANSDTFHRLLVPLLQEWGSLEIDAKSSLNLAHTLTGNCIALLHKFWVYVQATRKGETGLVLPTVTGKLPPVMKARQQPQYSTSQG